MLQKYSAKIRIPEKAISVLPDYLNPEHERDDTLLEGITPTEFSDLGTEREATLKRQSARTLTVLKFRRGL